MTKNVWYTMVAVIIASAVLGAWVFYEKYEAKSKNTKEFIALGDSLTYGVGDQKGEGYVGDLQYLLSKNQQGDVTVRNYGIPGQQSDGLLHQLGTPKVLNDLEYADYITVFIGMNDLIKSNGHDLNPLNEKRIQIGKADYERNLKEIFRIVRAKNPNAPILFLGLYNPYPSSEKIQQVIDEWNDTSRQIVSQHSKVKFIATDGLLDEKSQKYFSDTLHPNKKGYQLITKKIVKEHDF